MSATATRGADETAGVLPELLRKREVLILTAMSNSAFYRALAAGEFPRAVTTPSGPRWKRKAVMDWIGRLKTAR